ncbi:MAG TPA: glycosyl hydrolase [Saprospiraceae bacterium]|nr:glycosyl hydrolase [Saprospiraceae bacterium]
MMKILNSHFPLWILFVLFHLDTGFSQVAVKMAIPTIDQQATPATIAMFENLKNMSGRHILFGHQEDLAYGVHWKEWHKQRSDVHDVCGKYPAVFGWEVSKLGKRSLNIDSVDFNHIKGWIRRAYKIGGVNTISWHMDNYVNGESAWNVNAGNVVAAILPGGMKHEAYKKDLDTFADFVKALKVGFIFRKEIPIIFRPFHEHTGAWFWWGQPHCTPDQYKALWQFTVSYLRDEKGLHNILYAYSPDIFRDKDHYLECYPGDDWVDVLGMDDYYDLGPEGKPSELVRRLRDVVQLADARGKIPAMTETGSECIKNPMWWTQELLAPIAADSIASRIAWLLVWRNARETHHYAPYPGHASVPDFIQFVNTPIMMLSDRLPDVYRTP